MFKEFKEFIQKGNVLDFAVAVIMATAFGAVVNVFTKDVVMPFVGFLVGDVNFEDLKYVLKAASGEDNPEVAILWGKWVNTIINFLLVSLVMFFIIKAYNKMKKPEEPKEEAPAGPTQEELLIEIRDLLKKQ